MLTWVAFKWISLIPIQPQTNEIVTWCYHITKSIYVKLCIYYVKRATTDDVDRFSIGSKANEEGGGGGIQWKEGMYLKQSLLEYSTVNSTSSTQLRTFDKEHYQWWFDEEEFLLKGVWNTFSVIFFKRSCSGYIWKVLFTNAFSFIIACSSVLVNKK